MKIRPILMSAPMARALIQGRKTQTRRVLKPQPPDPEVRLNGPEWYPPEVVDRDGYLVPGAPVFGVNDDFGEWGLKCPYGAPGDLLWVREAFKPHYFKRWKPAYRSQWDGRAADSVPEPKWTASRYMPRWANRTTLELRQVGAQRVQEINEADARAEGSPCGLLSEEGKFYPDSNGNYRTGFAALWEHLNGKRGYGWDENPWVWALTFAVHQCNVDEFLRQTAA